MLPSGKRKHRVTIQAAALAPADSFGTQAEVWSDLATVWAEVRELSAVESPRQKASDANATSQVTILRRPDVTHRSRFLYGTRYLYPSSVTLSVDEREQICLCHERL